MGGRCNANDASGFISELREGGELRIDLIDTRCHSLIKLFARLRRRDAAGCSRQKTHAQARFEVANGMTERRLRHTELCCRSREALFARYGDEYEKVVQIFAGHPHHLFFGREILALKE